MSLYPFSIGEFTDNEIRRLKTRIDTGEDLEEILYQEYPNKHVNIAYWRDKEFNHDFKTYWFFRLTQADETHSAFNKNGYTYSTRIYSHKLCEIKSRYSNEPEYYSNLVADLIKNFNDFENTVFDNVFEDKVELFSFVNLTHSASLGFRNILDNKIDLLPDDGKLFSVNKTIWAKGLTGFGIFNEKGEMLYDFSLQSSCNQWVNANGFYILKDINRRFGVANLNDGVLLACNYNRISERFSLDNYSEWVSVCNDDNKWTLYNLNERKFFSNFIYESIESFSNGLAQVSVLKDNVKTSGFIDLHGHFIFKVTEGHSITDGFHEGFARIIYKDENNNLKNYYIDKNGEKINNQSYDYARSFSDGMALVINNSKYGFIDSEGNLVVDFYFDNAENFKNGLASVCLKRELKFHVECWGQIDKKGKMITPIIYEKTRWCCSSYVKLKENNFYEFFDNAFNKTTDHKFENAEYLPDRKLIKVKEKNANSYIIDCCGDFVEACDHIDKLNVYWKDFVLCMKYFFPADYKIAEDSKQDSLIYNQQLIHELLSISFTQSKYFVYKVNYIDNRLRPVGHFFVLFSDIKFHENKQIFHSKLTGFDWNPAMLEEISMSLAAPIATTYQKLFDCSPKIKHTEWISINEFSNNYISSSNHFLSNYFRAILEWKINENNETLSYIIIVDKSLIDYLFAKDEKLRKGADSYFLQSVKEVSFINRFL